MRSVIVRILGTALAFYVTAYLIGGFRIEPTWQAYLLASFIFVILNWTAGPVIKLLLLPINLLTLGLFRWLTNVIVLYIFDTLYGGITISAYRFPGMSTPLLSLPAGDINLFWTLVLSSLSISIAYSAITAVFARSE